MRISLADAVAAVPEDACIYLGNFGTQLFAVGAELVRQRRRGLHVVMASGGILLDQLIAEGVTAAVTTSHCWNPVGPAPTRHWQRSLQERELELRELSLGALCAALQAAAHDVPFWVTTHLRDTDYPARSGGLLAVARCALGEATVVAAVRPDVAFVHADRVDDRGDAWLEAPAADALLAAQAARRTVVVAEELGRGAGPATIPALLVDDVVVLPGAAAPDGAPGRYPRDVSAYAAWTEVAPTAVDRAKWRRGG